MARMRISTTVDAELMTESRRLLGGADSGIIDRSLRALIDVLETERETAALVEHPYESDPDLAWEAPPGPDLPYDGAVPTDVLRLAEQRRQASERRAG